jgi:hypothetical protein
MSFSGHGKDWMAWKLNMGSLSRVLIKKNMGWFVIPRSDCEILIWMSSPFAHYWRWHDTSCGPFFSSKRTSCGPLFSLWTLIFDIIFGDYPLRWLEGQLLNLDYSLNGWPIKKKTNLDSTLFVSVDVQN